MMTPGTLLNDLATDLKLGILFCTRLPLRDPGPVGSGDIARASWALPVAGALVGVIGALVYWIAFRSGLPALPAAALALAATLIATGALHEDGLADTADGFGGGKDREQKLAIMRDSRVGTYGACALILSLILRWSALVVIAAPLQVALALIAAHAAARATLPAFLHFVPQARADGLAAAAGRPPPASVVIAGLLGVIALGIALGPLAAIVALLLLLAASAFMAWLCTRQVGGQTGDVLGALEQVGEILILMVAVTYSAK